MSPWHIMASHTGRHLQCALLCWIAFSNIAVANSTTFKEDWRIRQAAAEALGLVNPEIDPGRPRNDAAKLQVPGFITTLGNMDRRLRQTAAEALGQVGDTQTVKPLKDEMAGWHAWEEWQKKNVMDARISVLKQRIADLRDKNWEVRQATAAALKQIAPDWPRSEAAKREVPGFITALGDENPWVRQAAAKALGQIGDTRAVEPLIVALRDTWGDFRSTVVAALERIDPDWPQSETAKRQIPLFITALGDKRNVSARWAAAEVLVQIGAPAMEPLIAALGDRHFDVCSDVVAALSRIAPDWPRSEAARRQVPMFIAALENEDWRVRGATAETLGRIGDVRAMEPLIAVLKDKDSWVRRGAAEALGWIGDARAVEPLIIALRDEMKNVRQSAAQSLERISPAWTQRETAKRQTPDLVATLRDEDTLIRTIAARTLGQIGDVRAVESLTPLLWDADVHVRQETVLAIGSIITPQQDSTLLRLKMTLALTLNALENLMSSLLPFLLVVGFAAYWIARELRWYALYYGLKIKIFCIFYVLAFAVGLLCLFAIASAPDNVPTLPWVIFIAPAAALFLLFHPLAWRPWVQARRAAQEFVCGECARRYVLAPGLPWLARWTGRTLATEDPKLHDDFKDYFVCGDCGSNKHRITGIREVVGVVGGPALLHGSIARGWPRWPRTQEIPDLVGGAAARQLRDDGKFHGALWSEQDLTARHADIDRLVIRAGNVSNYERAVNAVVNALRDDVSRPAAWCKQIPVTLEGAPTLSAGTVRMLEDTFMMIREG